jgi:peptidoglycan/xylan/chitin deacetylase (PgdA/CDA1 family)
MYHGISGTDERAASLHQITARTFRQHIELLGRCQRRVLEWSCIDREFKNPDDVIGITFDDGNASDLDAAACLRAAGYWALFFIPTAYVGATGRLSRRGLVDVSNMDMTIGSHSHRHVPLVGLDDCSLRDELSRSKAILEDTLGKPVLHLSVPGGYYDARVVRAARDLGYEYVHTSDWGMNRERDFVRRVVRRIPVLSAHSLRDFEAIVTMRSDLQRRLQFHSKQVAKLLLPEATYLKVRSGIAKRFRHGQR